MSELIPRHEAGGLSSSRCIVIVTSLAIDFEVRHKTPSWMVEQVGKVADAFCNYKVKIKSIWQGSHVGCNPGS